MIFATQFARSELLHACSQWYIDGDKTILSDKIIVCATSAEKLERGKAESDLGASVRVFFTLRYDNLHYKLMHYNNYYFSHSIIWVINMLHFTTFSFQSLSAELKTISYYLSSKC